MRRRCFAAAIVIFYYAYAGGSVAADADGAAILPPFLASCRGEFILLRFMLLRYHARRLFCGFSPMLSCRLIR